MSWVRWDDQFPIHRKVERLSDAAFRLHASAICWCARNLTDGYVGKDDLTAAAPRHFLTPEDLIDELVLREVWDPVEGGWEIHDYLEYQPSKARVAADRKKAAERQRRFKARSNAVGSEDDGVTSGGNGVGNALEQRVTSGTNGVQAGNNAVQTGYNATPSRPVPSRKEKDKDSSLRSPPRPDVEDLCEQLRTGIEANGVKATITTKWRTEARLMLDRDGRDFEQTKSLIDWATADDFWSAVVLSMTKVRTKYDTMLLQAKRDFRQRSRSHEAPTDRNIRNFLGAGAEDRQLPAGRDHV
jgi:hypothetical protein